MTNQELSKKILELLGGKENIVSAYNCMTRLRVTLKDVSRVKVAELKSTDGVLGVVEDRLFQVILGPGKAKKVCDLFLDDAGLDAPGEARADGNAGGDWEQNKESLKAGQKKSAWKQGLRNIADIFMPLIPAIIAAGLFNGFASLLGQTGIGKEQTEAAAGAVFIIITVFQLLGGAFLSYFAIYTGINAANKFGATPALGGMIGAMSIMPQIVTLSTAFGLYNEAEPLESVLTTGKGGIIGVILGVWLLSKVEKKLRKIIPDTLDLVVTPLLTLIVMSVVFVFMVMPLAGFVSDILVKGLSLLIASTNPIISIISGYVLSALFLPMVLLGLHHGLIPIYAIQLESMGGVTLFPVLAMAGAGQVGAAISIYLKARRVGNVKMQKIIYGALPAGFLGVGEPLIYGVTLPLGKPFITAGIGAGFGGAFVRLMGVSSVAWGPSGLVAIPMMSAPIQMLFFFIGLVIAYAMGFLITHIFIKDSDVGVKQDNIKDVPLVRNDQPIAQVEEEVRLPIYATQTGKVVRLEEVPDKVFSEKILGDGPVILPTDGKVYSPVNGVVAGVTDTLHAVIITADDGAEFLVHVGLDTVKLEGKGFKVLVKAGDVVSIGDQLLEVDVDLVKEAGFELYTPSVITDMDGISLELTNVTEAVGGETVVAYYRKD